MIALNFLPKEDWLAQRRTAQKARVSTAIMDYASLEEVTQIKAALRERFKLVTGESAEDIRYKRGCIRQAIRTIENGRLPAYAIDGAEDSLADIRQRYEAGNCSPPVEADQLRSEH